MSLNPISPPSHGSYLRYPSMKSNSPLLLSLRKFNAINSPFGSSNFNDFFHTPFRAAPSPKRTPRSFMSKLFSEQQLKDAMVVLDEYNLEVKEPISLKSISSRKRQRPESTKEQKVAKFTKTEAVSSESKSQEPSASSSESNSESSYEEESVYESPEFRESFNCKYCKNRFKSAQALGGHMSRKHPGKSYDYNRKKEVRKKRELERAKLLLAKKLFYKDLGYDYDKLRKMKNGKTRLRDLMNRARLKKFKADITQKELENFLKSIHNSP